MIILDTNVISEVLKTKPAGSVLQWLSGQDGATVYLSSITEAELRFWAQRMPQGKRQREVSQLINDVLQEDFEGQILSFGSAEAMAYANIASAREQAGHPISQFDCQIAATARTANAAVGPRNVKDFVNCGIEIIDPWAS